MLKTWLFVFISLALFLATRADVLTAEMSSKFLNSDNVLYVVMAEEIKQLKSFPVFYYGQNYMGPLVSCVMVLVQWVLELTGFHATAIGFSNQSFVVSPMASQLACFILTFAGLTFFTFAIKKVYDLSSAILALLLLSTGHELLMETSLRPNGPEMALCLAGALYWLYVYEKKNLFWLTLGFSWWMNQTVIFMVFPILFHWVAAQPDYFDLYQHFEWKNRFTLKKYQQNTSLKTSFKTVIKAFNAILILNFSLGVIISLLGGVDEWIGTTHLVIGNGFSLMKSSVMGWVALHIYLIYFYDARWKNWAISVFHKIKYYLGLFLLGLSPVWVGRLFHLYPQFYSVELKFVSVKNAISYWPKLFTEYPSLLLFGESNLLGTAFFWLLIFSLFYGARNYLKNYLTLKPHKYSHQSIFLGMFIVNGSFLFLSERARVEYAVRYGILLLPVLVVAITYWWQSFRSSRLPIWLSFTTMVMMMSSFGFSSYVSGQKYLDKIRQDQLPLSIVEALKTQGCQVLVAEYWKAYQIEYLTSHQILGVVYKGQERRPELAEERMNSSLKKCLFTSHQEIREYQLSDGR